MKHSVSTSLFAIVAALAAPLPALANNIGTAGAVNPDAKGTPPGGATKTLNVGGNVVYRERISTAANGSVQLIFVDRTTLNIGPNSQLVIDEFVYDPKTNTGRMAATLTKGVMRFVGGQTSHTGGATIKTPATTLGVRGGVATIKHDASTGTRVINHFGTITAQTSTGTEVIRRPGFALNIATTQTAPTAPVRVARSEIDTNNQQLTSRGSQTGGRRETPTDQGASRAVGQANAPVAPTLVQGQQAQNTQQAAQVTTQPNTMQQDVPLQQVAQVSTTGTQQTVAATLPTVAPTVAPTVVPTPAVVLPQRRFYQMTENNALRIGDIIPSAFNSQGNWYDSAVNGYGLGGTNTDGSPNTTSRLMAAGMVINGQRSAQTSTIYLATMDVLAESQGITSGGVAATTRLNSTARAGRLGASMTGTAGGTVLDSAYSPTSILITDADVSNNTRIPGSAGYTLYAPSGAATGANYTYQVGMERGVTPPTLGAVRPQTTLVGMLGGLWNTNSTTTGQPTSLVPVQASGSVVIDLTSSSRFGATMNVERNSQRFGTADDFNRATIQYGHQGSGTRSRSAYVDYDYFGARTARANNGTLNGQSLSSIERITPSGTASSVPNNELGLMVNSQAVGASTFFPGVTFCQCDYTRWGFWSYTATRDGLNAQGGADIVRDSVHLGTWVAGVVSPATQLPTTGTAVYTGHAIGSFRNGASEYVAAGNFSSTVNFATASSTYAITNLDGRNYTGTAVLSPTVAPNGVSAMLYHNNNVAGVSSSGARIFPHGAFFNGAAGPGGELAGRFNVFGSQTAVAATPYSGSGIFAARR